MNTPGRARAVDPGLLVAAGVVCTVLIAGYVDALVFSGSPHGHRFGSLVDHHGHAFASLPASRAFKVVAFGYTQCPEICPTTLVKVHRVLDALGPVGNQVTPLFITLDPAHDTPQALELYTAMFDPRIIGITGSTREMRAFASTYGVYPRDEDPTDMHEAISHSSMIYLLGHDNEMLAVYRPALSPQSIASDIGHMVEIATK